MTDTRTKILDLAEDLTQRVGFNGFSYLDLAAEIGIKNSSIHYHFKAKADLALALVTRIRETHLSALDGFEVLYPTPKLRIAALIDHFRSYLDSHKICMCGMLAAEFASVNLDVQNALALYFGALRGWLSRQFEEMGRVDHDSAAIQLLSALEGSLLLARVENDPTLVDRSLTAILNPPGFDVP